MEAKQTPLIELLERVPQDARVIVEHDQFSSSSHPVGRLCHEAAAALRAALAEPVQEPVTWRWGYRSITTGEMDWRGYVEIPSHPNLRSPAIIMEPLYTAPPQRKPLTDEKLDELAMDKDGLPNSHIEFARAIERAHGIGAPPCATGDCIPSKCNICEVKE